MKRILVALDGSAYSKAAQDYACHLAKAQHAEVTGIAIIDLPRIERSIGPVPLGATAYAIDLRRHKVQEAKAQARDILKRFGQTCSGGLENGPSPRKACRLRRLSSNRNITIL